MSCYFRHLKEILAEAGIEVTPQNKKQIDQLIHQIVKVDYKNCPKAWKHIKEQVIHNDQKRLELVKKLKATVK